ncbi:MAG: primase protein [Microgenomates group bacterium GW2011_GWC2_45_8]|nr:MAG: primase protein [Parcubacteria group bacterium GW2011_GWA2_42_18]KKT75546.1 MAG: primase protein [Parcubacteria group bacterium GW2011_GWB1_44_7]KKU14878.1 MAG: primase protein [Microgenomates group bacterium GW2011_GWC2_45_8]
MTDSVEKIKERLGITELIGSYIKLEKAGKNLKARCPFHNEKTPSFFVSPDRGSFYCFGCGAKGDIFSFVEQMEGLDFKGALKLLAERAGVKLEYRNVGERDSREKIFQILEEAAKYFEANLKLNDEAKTYLEKRGVKEKTRIMFRLGFAPDEWRSLLTHLKSKKFSENDLAKAGLIKKGETGGNYYDRFRNRIIFPIADSAGRIVGFSGRILKGKSDDAKYINSPETELFVKSRILYGLDKAKAEIRRRDFAVLVEGQMDLLLSHQVGVANTVASSGTALTDEHINLLKRFSDRLLLVFDPDEAGFKAALRGAGLALARGLEVKVAALPEGLDPADLVLKNPISWKNALKNAVFLIDFLLARILNKGYDKRQLAKATEKEILPYIASLGSRIEQSHYISEIVDKANIKEEALWEELRKAKPIIGANLSISRPERDYGATKEKLTKLELLERRLFGVLFAEKDKELESKLKNIFDEKEFEIALEFWRPFREAIIFEAEENLGGEISEKEIAELLGNLKSEKTREKFLQKTRELAEAEKTGNTVQAKKLMEECQKLSKEISN